MQGALAVTRINPTSGTHDQTGTDVRQECLLCPPWQDAHTHSPQGFLSFDAETSDPPTSLDLDSLSILVPSHEVALQTAQAGKTLGEYLDVQVMVVANGASLEEDTIRLSMPIRVLVGTPNRMLDLAEKNVVGLSEPAVLAIDQAYKLPSREFAHVVELMLSFLPSERQVMLFSDTFPRIVKELKDKDTSSPCDITVMDELTLRGVTQYYSYVEERQKVHRLNTLLSKLRINQCIIFCASTNRVELLAKRITNLGHSCFYLHPKMLESHRIRVFRDFRKGLCRTLVCTDLPTPGIDIQAVNVAVNFDLPKDGEAYLHRVGRPGPFGHLGLVINFVGYDDRFDLYKIEKELGTVIQPIPESIDVSLYVAVGEERQKLFAPPQRALQQQ